jgi:hypothetical protein
MSVNPIYKTVALLLVLAASAVHGQEAATLAEQHLIQNDQADWALKVELNHPDGNYVIGERLEIRVQAPRDCYINILNINPNGEFGVLWPMDENTSNFVKSGGTIQFPDNREGQNFVFRACEPAGRELVVCMATETPLNIRDREEYRKFLEFMKQAISVSPSGLDKVKGFVTQVERKPNGWSAQVVELVTRRPGQDEVAPLTPVEPTVRPQPNKPTPPAPVQTARPSLDGDLKQFGSEDGKVRVLMPASAQIKDSKAEIKGYEATIRIISSLGDQGRSVFFLKDYLVNQAAVVDARKVLADAVDGQITALSTEESQVHRREIEVSGYVAEEIVIVSPEITIRIRVNVSETDFRINYLSYAGLPGTEADPDVEAIFESLELDP